MCGYVHMISNMWRSQKRVLNLLMWVLGNKLRPLHEQSMLLNSYTYVQTQLEKNWKQIGCLPLLRLSYHRYFYIRKFVSKHEFEEIEFLTPNDADIKNLMLQGDDLNMCQSKVGWVWDSVAVTVRNFGCQTESVSIIFLSPESKHCRNIVSYLYCML